MQNCNMMWNLSFDGTSASSEDIHSQLQRNH